MKNICAVARNKVRSLDRTFMAVSDLFFFKRGTLETAAASIGGVEAAFEAPSWPQLALTKDRFGCEAAM